MTAKNTKKRTIRVGVDNGVDRGTAITVASSAERDQAMDNIANAVKMIDDRTARSEHKAFISSLRQLSNLLGTLRSVSDDESPDGDNTAAEDQWVEDHQYQIPTMFVNSVKDVNTLLQTLVEKLIMVNNSAERQIREIGAFEEPYRSNLRKLRTAIFALTVVQNQLEVIAQDWINNYQVDVPDVLGNLNKIEA